MVLSKCPYEAMLFGLFYGRKNDVNFSKVTPRQKNSDFCAGLVFSVWLSKGTYIDSGVCR
jgi:hypothetical protein